MNDTVSVKKAATLIKWGLALVAVTLLAPVIMLTVKGLIGLALATFVGSAAVFGAPVVAQLFEVWRLKGIKAVAAANPVEQLQAVLMERQQALSDFSSKITIFATHVRQFESKLASFSAQFPSEVGKFQEQLDAMRRLLQLRRDRYEEVKKQLQLFEIEVKKAEAIWKMSQAAAELNKAAGMESGDVFAKIKSETAVDAIELSLNQSFAELETALLEETKVSTTLPYSASVKQSV